MQLSSDHLNLDKVVSITLTSDDAQLNCLDELVQHVRDLTAIYPAPYHLFVSGGIDSQAMLYVWMLAEVPFHAIRVDYLGFNEHDFIETKMFCNRHGIPLHVKKFDLVNFLENELDQYANAYQCASPQICTHMAFSKMAGEGTAVFSGNLPAIDRIPIDNTMFGLQRYATMTNANLIPFFLLGNERSARASMIVSKQFMADDQSAYDFKVKHYRALGIPVYKQRDKLTGFEKIKDHYDQYSDRVTARMKSKHSALPSKRVFDQLFRNPYLKKFNNHYTATLIVKDE